ncbi:hypothetical protein, partial [Sulfoacidibacillus thermotolerans]
DFYGLLGVKLEKTKQNLYCFFQFSKNKNTQQHIFAQGVVLTDTLGWRTKKSVHQKSLEHTSE